MRFANNVDLTVILLLSDQAGGESSHVWRAHRERNDRKVDIECWQF